MSDKRPHHHLEAAARRYEKTYLDEIYKAEQRYLRGTRPPEPDNGPRPHDLERAAQHWAALADFDQHENGQLRLVVAGEQTHLLPLPDSLIPQPEETP